MPSSAGAAVAVKPAPDAPEQERLAPLAPSSPRQMRLRESGSRRRRTRKAALARCAAGAVACCRGRLAHSLSHSLPRSVHSSLPCSLPLALNRSVTRSLALSLDPSLLPSLPRSRACSIPHCLSLSLDLSRLQCKRKSALARRAAGALACYRGRECAQRAPCTLKLVSN
jgi:hypothetical protein